MTLGKVHAACRRQIESLRAAFYRAVAQPGLERYVRDVEVAGSNPVRPTIQRREARARLTSELRARITGKQAKRMSSFGSNGREPDEASAASTTHADRR